MERSETSQIPPSEGENKIVYRVQVKNTDGTWESIGVSDIKEKATKELERLRASAARWSKNTEYRVVSEDEEE